MGLMEEPEEVMNTQRLEKMGTDSIPTECLNEDPESKHTYSRHICQALSEYPHSAPSSWQMFPSPRAPHYIVCGHNSVYTQRASVQCTSCISPGVLY